MHPSDIMNEMRVISGLLRQLFCAKSREELDKQLEKVNEELKKAKRIPELNEYCLNVEAIMEAFNLDGPNGCSRDKSLLKLLSLNEKLRVKVIQDFNLCSEPDY